MKLYLYFFYIGWFTFGGGWSIVAQIQKDFVEKQRSLDGEEPISGQDLLDIVSVGRSLPGTMIGNVAYLFGYNRAGVPGAVMSVLGIITPPIVLLSVITVFYTRVRDNALIARALIGVRAVVAPVILSAVLKLHKGAFPKKICYALCAVSCVLSLVWGVSAVLLVGGGILAGLLVTRGGGKDGDAPC